MADRGKEVQDEDLESLAGSLCHRFPLGNSLLDPGGIRDY